MKNFTRILSCVIALVMAISMFGIVTVFAGDHTPVYDGTSVSESLQGEGTEASPYLIASGADLKYFEQNAAATTGKYYKLTADIVWSNYTAAAEAPTASNWTPVTFDGTFDGDGHTVYGICIVSNAADAAFFACANGTIKNFTLRDSFISGKDTVGGIVASTKGSTDPTNPTKITVDNCVNYANITATKGSSLKGVGGIVASIFSNSDDRKVYIDANITNCVNYGNISASGGNAYSAGIVGRLIGSSSTIANCANFGDITSTAGICGGIVGQSLFGDPIDGYNAEIRDCFNAGTITATLVVGGIAGRAYTNTSIKNCVNIGTVNATKANDARFGGIDGHNVVTSVNSYTIAGSAVNTASSELAKTGDVGAVEKTDAELNTTDIVTALGEAWELAAGKLTLKIVASAGTVDEDETPDSDTTTATPPEVTTKPSDDVTTKPADVTTKPADVTTTPADVTTTEPKDDDTTATTPVDNDTTTKAPVTTTAPTTTETPKKEKGCGGFAVAAQLIAVIGAGLTVVVLKKKI